MDVRLALPRNIKRYTRFGVTCCR